MRRFDWFKKFLKKKSKKYPYLQKTHGKTEVMVKDLKFQP